MPSLIIIGFDLDSLSLSFFKTSTSKQFNQFNTCIALDCVLHFHRPLRCCIFLWNYCHFSNFFYKNKIWRFYLIIEGKVPLCTDRLTFSELIILCYVLCAIVPISFNSDQGSGNVRPSPRMEYWRHQILIGRIYWKFHHLDVLILVTIILAR